MHVLLRVCRKQNLRNCARFRSQNGSVVCNLCSNALTAGSDSENSRLYDSLFSKDCCVLGWYPFELKFCVIDSKFMPLSFAYCNVANEVVVFLWQSFKVTALPEQNPAEGPRRKWRRGRGLKWRNSRKGATAAPERESHG